jgi:Ca2+-binding EF-hand superfamily protein
MNDAMQRAMRGSAPPPGARGVPPQGDQADRGAARPGIGAEGGSSNRSNRSSSSSRSRRRSSRSSDSDNAIKTNPLFQLFDTDGNGQLSLEEIDAASRILYMLDANEDDRITADEVEDLAGGGSDDYDSNARRDNDRDDDRQTNRSRSNRTGSNNRSNRDFSDRMSQNGMSDRGKNSGSSSKKKSTNRRGGRDFSSRMSQNGMSDNGQGGDASKKRDSGSSRNQGGDSDFDQYDKNGDGVLKRTELSSRLRLKFRKMDANEDGEVDPDEFDEYMSDPALNGGVR